MVVTNYTASYNTITVHVFVYICLSERKSDLV